MAYGGMGLMAGIRAGSQSALGRVQELRGGPKPLVRLRVQRFTKEGVHRLGQPRIRLRRGSEATTEL